MSGPLSAAFALIALVLHQEGFQKFLLHSISSRSFLFYLFTDSSSSAELAVLGAVIASYAVWAQERKARINLESRIQDEEKNQNSS